MKYPNNNLYCINIFMKYLKSNFFKFFLHVSSNNKKCIIRFMTKSFFHLAVYMLSKTKVLFVSHLTDSNRLNEEIVTQ